MALTFYGNMLINSNEKRKEEAEEYMRYSDQISAQLPAWHDKLDNMYMPKFELWLIFIIC